MTDQRESDSNVRQLPKLLEHADVQGDDSPRVAVVMSEHAAGQLALACHRARSRFILGSPEDEWLAWGGSWLIHGARMDAEPQR